MCDSRTPVSESWTDWNKIAKCNVIVIIIGMNGYETDVLAISILSIIYTWLHVDRMNKESIY